MNELSKKIEEALSQVDGLRQPTPAEIRKAIDELHAAYALLNSLPNAKPINPNDDLMVYSRMLGRAIGKVWNACNFLNDKPPQP